MGYSVQIALRYLGSKQRAFVSVGTAIAMLGVALGVAALSIVMSVTGGFHDQFREKVLGVNAHVIVLKYAVHFRDYRDVMKTVMSVPGVVAVEPFVINPMMITHGDRTATGVLLKGVDPTMMPRVLDLPRHIVEGSLDGMRKADAKPPEPPPGNDPSPDSDIDGATDEHDAGKPRADSAPISPDGGKLSVLEAIEQRIAHNEEARAHPDAGVDTILDAGAPTASSHAALLPAGNITPQGGFASTLPEDDVLPAGLDSNPCKSPEQVKSLPGVVIGRTLAKRLAVGFGDCLQITSPQIGMAFGASGARPPIAKQFRVIAIFEAGFDQYDSKLVYIDLYEAQAFYEQGDSVTGVEAKVSDIEQAASVAKEVDKLLSSGVYHTTDWRELNHALFTALAVQQIFMSIVLALIIVVAAFTVIATLIMVVLDKKTEIALLKAIGASDDAILRIFVYQGGIIGVVGTVLGLLLGWGGCKALAAYGFPLDPKVYFISKLPVNIRPNEFLLTGAIAILICLVATIFPALYAARLRPSDGLRAE